MVLILVTCAQNRVAQRKFRAKTKQKMVHTTMQLEQLEQQMDALMREKQLLESKNRVLQHTVKLSSSHYSDLQAQRVRPTFLYHSLLSFFVYVILVILSATLVWSSHL